MVRKKELTVLHEFRQADEQTQAHEGHQDHGVLEDAEDGDCMKRLAVDSNGKNQ